MKYQFQENGHKHFLDGKRATGVTTILGVIAKPALIGWSARMASEYVLENLKDLNEIERVCEEAKNAHRIKKEDAGQKGTDVHALVESLIKESIAKNGGFIKKDGPELPPNTESDNKQVQNFIDWATKNKVKFLESEKPVYSEKMFCAGICDFVCEINGEKLVGDLKTGSGIYPEHFYQVAAYRMMLEEMGEKDFKGSVIVNIKKDGTFNEDQDVIINYSYEDERNAFLAAWTLYRVGQGFSKNKFNNKL